MLQAIAKGAPLAADLDATRLALVAVVLLAIVLRMRVGGIAAIVTSRPAAWIARLALAGIGVAAGVVLVSDVAEIL